MLILFLWFLQLEITSSRIKRNQNDAKIFIIKIILSFNVQIAVTGITQS